MNLKAVQLAIHSCKKAKLIWYNLPLHSCKKAKLFYVQFAITLLRKGEAHITEQQKLSTINIYRIQAGNLNI
jgi:hypothetical protein